MNKKTGFIIGGIVLAIVLVVGGIFAYKKKDESSPNTNAKYTECVEEANALQEKNDNIADQVEADIEKCTRDYIKAQGYNDDIDCIESYNNPICDEEKYDEDGNNIGRYNAEVNGSNQCNEDLDQKYIDAGYDNTIIPAVDCVKYLGEK